MIGNPSLSECVGRHDFENKPITKYFVDEFHGAEGVCFPLRTRYATNAEIANCANHLLPYPYNENIKIDEAGANRRIIDCLSSVNQEKIGRIGFGFSRNLFEKLIAVPMVYIDKHFTFDHSLKTYPTNDQFYNIVDALIMAKYASALVQIGFQPDQIGFIVSPHLDAQQFVLRCLLKQKLNLADEVLRKLAIGSEFDFQEKNWATRDNIIIRSGVETAKQQMEKELARPRFRK